MGIEGLSLHAFLLALAGMVGVFLALAALCHLIARLAPIDTDPLRRAPAPQKTAAAPAAHAVYAGTAGGHVALIDVDEKTAACIMAIVSHESGIPLSGLIFKSIRAL